MPFGQHNRAHVHIVRNTSRGAGAVHEQPSAILHDQWHRGVFHSNGTGPLPLPISQAILEMGGVGQGAGRFRLNGKRPDATGHEG